MALYACPPTNEERRTIETLARSRTAPARLVERAKIISLSLQGRRVPFIARELGLHPQTVRDWLNRFNAQGLPGLEDQPRPGKPPTYTAEDRSVVIVTALTNPLQLGQPFACWTLDRLEVYLNEHEQIPIKRSRIDEILIAEGLRWRQQETWFSEKAVLEAGPEQEPSLGSDQHKPDQHQQEAPEVVSLVCQCGAILSVPEALETKFDNRKELVLSCENCRKLSIVDDRQVVASVDPMRVTRWTESFY